jgi:hypothetical protein
VCGPEVDGDLVRFAADLDWLKKQGVAVERYNVAQEPGAFMGHDRGNGGGVVDPELNLNHTD